MSSPTHNLRQLRDSLRDYVGDVGPRNVPQLWQRDWQRAYAILVGDDDAALPAGGPRRWWAITKRLFLAMSAKLSPPRRLLFVLSLLCAVLGGWTWQIEIQGHTVRASNNPLVLLAAFVALLVLLALELADRVLIRDELEVARALQHELLPQQPPSIPGYDAAFSYRTANTVGGDYYDVRVLADGRVALVSADASGHGIAAAMLMAIANAVLGMAIETDPAPAAVARLLNQALLSTGGTRAFVTLFYALLEPASGRLDYACAGHPFPLLRRHDGTLEQLGKGAFPLGLRREPEPATGSSHLHAGDLLVLYTDGFPEAQAGVTAAGEDETFGYERLQRCVAAGGTAIEVRDRLLAELAAFEGDRPPRDDRTVVVVQRTLDG